MNAPDEPNDTADLPSVAADSLDAGLAAGFARPADEPAGGLPAVPGYRVVREIGRGGMGKVLAAHDLGLDREVALKVLLPGASPDRFVRESRITARLPHPGVPPVHALGTLANGSPFLAMKLVAGQTLAAGLTSSDRPQLLQAFTQVCQAVGFAHSRGVIHRDLKPANVMVGAFGEVQVMDWGLAKDLSDRPTAEPRSSVPLSPAVAGGSAGETGHPGEHGESTDDRTRAGAVMGTPAYMAPEQARGEPADARADVFALGGILCAILTGHPPFRGESSREVVRRAAAADLAEAHARLDGCGADAELLALCRRCLSADPADRPADGRAVADELTAHLNGVQDRLQAAEVARATEAARAKEAVRTAAAADERARAERRARRVQLVAACLLLMILTGGIVGTAFGLVRAERARGRAETAEGETKKRADELQQVANFQGRMLGQVDPAAAGLRLSGDVKARFGAALAKAGVPEGERAAQADAFASQWGRVNATGAALALIDDTILKPAAVAIDQQFQDQPGVDAALRTTLAERYLDLGLYDPARPLLERALETRRRTLGDEHPDTLASISILGSLHQKQGQLSQARPYFEEALGTSRRVMGADHRTTLAAVSMMGSLVSDQGDLDAAHQLHREALDGRRRVLGEDDPDTLSSLSFMAGLLMDMSKPQESLAYHREVLERRRRVLGENHRQTLSSLNNLGVLLSGLGDTSGAVECFREVVERRRRLLGEVHPNTLSSVGSLGVTLSDAGKDVEAEGLMREAVDNQRRLLGADHPSTLTSQSNLAVFLVGRGRASDAEPMCREVLERRRRVLGTEHRDTLISLNVLAFAFLNQNKPDQAEPYAREALATSRRIHGEEHQDTLKYAYNLGKVLRDQSKLSEAEPLLRGVIETGGRALGAEHAITLSAKVTLGDVLNRSTRYAEAAELLAALEPVARKTPTAGGGNLLALLLRDLGKARIGLKQFEAAETNLLEAYPMWVKRSGTSHTDTRNCVQAVVDLYAAWDTAQPGKGYDAKATDWKAKLSPP